MINLHTYSKISITSIRQLFRIDARNVIRLDKEKTALFLYLVGIVLMCGCSINISFFWKFSTICPIFSAGLIIMAMLLSNSMEKRIFTRTDFLLPSLLCLIAYFYSNLVHNISTFGYILVFFKVIIYISIFRLDPKYYRLLADILCKSLAILLAVSMTFFLLYHLGFSLPGRNVSWGDWYYYTDYFFFLLDDRSMFELLPRFHAVFLEPGHMGTTIVLLLATQIGYWDRWYNRIMMLAMVLSFSLAAYGLFVILLFLRMWILRKNVLRSLIITCTLLAAVVGGSFVYKQGDNMLNQLIVMRLAINETGDGIEGNNRNSEEFLRNYEGFLHSSDVIFGRGQWVENGGGGNAGYKLYLYENGIFGFLLIYLFYYISMRHAKDRRLLISMMLLSLANFWIRSYPLWLAFYVPYYLMASQTIPQLQLKTFSQQQDLATIITHKTKRENIR